MQLDEYIRTLEAALAACRPLVSRQLTFSKVTSHIGYVKGSLVFADNSILHFREYLNLKRSPAKLSYSYHYSKEQGCIFRYDNAPHHRKVQTFPHHKHVGEKETVHASASPTLPEVLDEIASHFKYREE